MPENTYAQDVAFLSKFTKVVELSGQGSARIAVAPGYQGRVMTSTFNGANGPSFGWINAKSIESPAKDPRFKNYGGEDRFWLGPEAGQFGLWFAKGEPFDAAHWRTPKGLDSGKFSVTSQGKKSVAMASQFDVTNYSGTTFHCAVKRIIRALSYDQAAEQLGATIGGGVKMAAFESCNLLANVGDAPWTRDGGLLSIWILGQFKPLPRGKVIVPFGAGDEKTLGVKATTGYFGPLSADRCTVGEDHLLFSCDGKYRSKIGISPRRAKDVLGSYDPDAGVLTVVQFNLPGGAPRLPYVNSLWKLQDNPFAGDAINSYNDGPETPGAAPMGPFYEIETSSAAEALKPGRAVTHVHRTYHFAGSLEELNDLAVRVLGVDLHEIQ